MTEKKADKILFNGRLITMEDEALAQAIAIKGDRIVYVGTTDEAMKLAHDHTQRIDLGGRVAAPGFVESHTHSAGSGANLFLVLDMRQVYSLEELGIADALGMEDYILCGLGIVLLMLICLPFAPLMIPGDPALGRLLCSKGRPAWKQALCDYAAYVLALLCLLGILLAGALIFMPELLAHIPMILGMLPAILLIASFSFIQLIF